MDITTIQQFLSVVRHGSFSAAARELDMVASSVSRQITQLETQLEVPLFVRTTRKLVLTEAGHIFENRARVILSALEEATLAVKDLDQNPKGTLRVTAPMAIGRLHLVKATIDYMTLWPEVNVEIDLSDQHWHTRRFDVCGASFGWNSTICLRQSRLLREKWYSLGTERPEVACLPDVPPP